MNYPRLLNLLQAAVAAGHVINVAVAMNHGQWAVAVGVSAFLAGAEQYLHTEGIGVLPPGK